MDETTIKRENRKEIARWFMDVAKYIATAVLVSTFIGEFSQKWLIYSIGCAMVTTLFLLGLRILYKK